MKKTELKKIEKFVTKKMSRQIAHDFHHVNRVRNWALLIAKNEKYSDMNSVEAAALLHDIGLCECKKRSEHGEIGSIIAEKFLWNSHFFDENKISEIANAIRFHNKNRYGSGLLLFIIRDADILDLLGAVGIMRGLKSKYNLDDYDPGKIKGETWNFSARDFDKIFDKGIERKYISDQINFQLSCFENLKTKTAKKIAKPMVNYMKNFLIHLESEVKHKTLN